MNNRIVDNDSAYAELLNANREGRLKFKLMPGGHSPLCPYDCLVVLDKESGELVGNFLEIIFYAVPETVENKPQEYIGINFGLHKGINFVESQLTLQRTPQLQLELYRTTFVPVYKLWFWDVEYYTKGISSKKNSWPKILCEIFGIALKEQKS